MHRLRQRESAGRKILRALRRRAERDGSRRRCTGTVRAAEHYCDRAAPGYAASDDAAPRGAAASADAALGCADRQSSRRALRTAESSAASASRVRIRGGATRDRRT